MVVVSISGPDHLTQCISALDLQPGSAQMDVHIVSKNADQIQKDAPWCFSSIHWHQVSAATTVPKMRTHGIMHASADLIALLEDDCTVGPRWQQSILEAHRSTFPAIGGPVEPGAYTRGIDWGIYYCEYARFLSPFSGLVPALAGNNVSYKRKALDLESIREGLYEIFLHETWQKSGIELHAANGMEVQNNHSWHLQSCVSTPFHHGRAYAGQRFGRRLAAKKFLYGVLAIMLPLLKTFRTIREVTSRQRSDLPLLKALPWVVLFHCCWSLGELVGYLAGPGRSSEKWH